MESPSCDHILEAPMTLIISMEKPKKYQKHKCGSLGWKGISKSMITLKMRKIGFPFLILVVDP